MKQSNLRAADPGLLRFARNDEGDMQTKQPTVYIMASGRNGSVYTGVTSNLPRRAWLHRTGAIPGFTKQYGCKKLVWYEMHATMPNAIAREKQIKGGSRQKKLALIEASNPTWRDLFDELNITRHCEERSDEAIQGRRHRV